MGKAALKEITLSEAGLSPTLGQQKMVALWAEVKDGKVLIRGPLAMNEDAVKSQVQKYVRINASELETEMARNGG